MHSFLPPLRPVTLANRLKEYILVVLKGYVKADLGKKLQEAVKRLQRFGWFVVYKRGKVLVQRYYPDINKKVSATIPIL